VATGHQWAINYQRTQRSKVRLSFTQLRHRDWLHLVPHFCFAGELSVRIANPETYRYVGPDTLRLNTLPYRADTLRLNAPLHRAGYTARRPVDWPISQKLARGWADVTRRASDKIFDPYPLLRTSHFALKRKSLLLLDLKCEVTATSH
jgi:hypothetical protein